MGKKHEEAFKEALYDEQVALKVLGGMGVRNHVNDDKHVSSVLKTLVDITNLDPEDVECMVCIIKVRTLGVVSDEDKYQVLGATIGDYNELIAMQAVSAARIRQAELQKEYQDGNVDRKAN